MCKKGTESWLVLEEDTYELNYSALVEKGLKGVILNLSDATTKRINHENIGYKDIPVFDLINQIKDATSLSDSTYASYLLWMNIFRTY
jgi:hypothetical protein